MKDILKQLAAEAKDDGDTKEQWLSTLSRNLIFMFQQGQLPIGTDINQMMREAPAAWGND